MDEAIEDETQAQAEALDIYGVAEIVELLGISPQGFHYLRRMGTFPQPDKDLAMGPVWRGTVVREAVATRRRALSTVVFHCESCKTTESRKALRPVVAELLRTGDRPTCLKCHAPMTLADEDETQA